jgi:dihydrofolate reductase
MIGRYYGTLECMISIVVAMDSNRLIGANNMIPWRLRSDLQRLRDLTKDRIVIVGRMTYESMLGYYERSGKRMPGAVYIVIVSESHYKPKVMGDIAVNSIEAALKAASDYNALHPVLSEEYMVIGGSSIYEAMLPYAERIYLTQVHCALVGDRYFPVIASDEWRRVSIDHHKKDSVNEYDYDFVLLERFGK